MINKVDKVKIAARAEEVMRGELSCSESVVYAVSEGLTGEVNTDLVRAATAFRGGFASTKEELCGALSGGGMIIGLLYGRPGPEVTAVDKCAEVGKAYRAKFEEKFGCTICKELRASNYGYGEGQISCAILVRDATAVLLDVLEEAEAE